MRPEQVVAAKLELLGSLEHPGWRRMAERTARMWGLTESIAMNIGVDGEGGSQFADLSSQQSIQSLRQELPEAVSYRVTPDMSRLIDYAANDLDSATRSDVTLAPSPAGLVRFEEPIVLHDVNDAEMKVSWAAWVPTARPEAVNSWVDLTDEMREQMLEASQAMWVLFFNDQTTHPDDLIMRLRAGRDVETVQAMQSVMGQFRLIGLELYRPWNNIGQKMTVDEKLPRRYLNHDTGEVSQEATAFGGGRAISLPVENLNRIMHAMWLLMGQKVATVTEEIVRKHHRQLAERANSSSTVNVLALRSRQSAPPARRQGESTVEWSKRWPVRGHWRNARVGEGRQDTRRVWIDGYVKGPAGKPLVTTPRVYDVRPDPGGQR